MATDRREDQTKGGEDVMPKIMRILVSDELHDEIVRAARVNNNDFEEWVRNACKEAIEYDQRRDRERKQRRKAVTPERPNAIYDILVADAGAREADRTDFVAHMLGGCQEYRCCQNLGTGGKFYPKTMTVDYYNEDRTSERELIRETVNRKLAELAKS